MLGLGAKVNERKRFGWNLSFMDSILQWEEVKVPSSFCSAVDPFTRPLALNIKCSTECIYFAFRYSLVVLSCWWRPECCRSSLFGTLIHSSSSTSYKLSSTGLWYIEERVVVHRKVLLDRLVFGYPVRKGALIANGISASSCAMPMFFSSSWLTRNFIPMCTVRSS